MVSGEITCHALIGEHDIADRSSQGPRVPLEPIRTITPCTLALRRASIDDGGGFFRIPMILSAVQGLSWPLRQRERQGRCMRRATHSHHLSTWGPVGWGLVGRYGFIVTHSFRTPFPTYLIVDHVYKRAGAMENDGCRLNASRQAHAIPTLCRIESDDHYSPPRPLDIQFLELLSGVTISRLIPARVQLCSTRKRRLLQRGDCCKP